MTRLISTDKVSLGFVTILPESARAIVQSGHLAHVVTLNADGSPQVSCTWVAMDGDELVMMHTAEHVKVRNLRRDPRVAISIESEQSSEGGVHPPFQLYLVIYGTATVVEGAAPDLAPLICSNYGSAAPPSVPPGYVTRVTIDRVGGVGPWVEQS
ncbi:MAG TPA: PPOX class F420-dependent oxidoreductase [Acidimicrobiales bacterium]|nr:PPOX class F420-dependent oxidoreductase [Acidimicrobiales bacterium]